MARASRSFAQSSRLALLRPLLEGATFVLALLGVLVVVHLWIQLGRGFDRGCLGFTTSPGVEAAFDCDVVVQSEAGTVFGISNVWLGLVFYLVVAGITAVIALSQGQVAIRTKQARMLLVAGGALYAWYLIYYQAVVIGEYCALCLTSAGIVTLLLFVQLALLTGPRRRLTEPTVHHQSMKRLPTLYAVLAGFTILLAGADLTYFNLLPDAPAPPDALQSRTISEGESVAPECTFNDEVGPIRNHQEFVSFADPMKGKADAPVTVIVYFDPNCPHCKTLEPIIDEVIEEYGDQARFVYKAFPLWQHSVAQVHALYAAAQEGKFFEMKDYQFRLQRREGLSMDILKAIAAEIGMNPDPMQSRIEAGIYTTAITKDRQQAIDAGIRSMPAVLINGRAVAGSSRSTECIGEMIAQAASR